MQLIGTREKVSGQRSAPRPNLYDTPGAIATSGSGKLFQNRVVDEKMLP